MKVTRTSGLPIEPTDIAQYQTELEQGLEAINQEMGRFEKLTQKEQAEFMKRFEEMKETVRSKYAFEQDWDLKEMISSKGKLKELVNKFGIIAFAKGSEDKRVQCWILDN